LVAAEQATRTGDGPVARWWSELSIAAESVVTTTSLDDLLSLALDMTRSALGADTATIVTADESGDKLVARLSSWDSDPGQGPHGGSKTNGAPIRPGAGAALLYERDGLLGRIFTERKAIVVDDLSSIEGTDPEFPVPFARSVVAAPIVSGDRVLGVVHADSRSPGQFDAVAAEMMQLVADRLAVAIWRVGLFEEERAARARVEVVAERLSRLQRVTAALSGDLGTYEVAADVLAALTPDLGSGIAVATMWLVAGDSLVLACAANASSAAREFESIPLDAPLPGPAAVRSRTGIWIESRAELDARFPDLLGRATEGQAFAVVPIATDTDVLGIVSLSFTSSHRFDDAEKQFLDVVANQMAQALDRAQMRRAETRIAEQARFLYGVSAVVGGSLDYRDTIREAVETLVPSFADMATVHLIDEIGGLVRGAVAHKDPAVQAMLRSADELNIHERRGVLKAAQLAGGATVLHNDLRSDDQIVGDEGHRRVIDAIGIRSTIAVPLVARSRTIAVLGLMRLEGSEPFDEADRRLAEEIGRRTAVAIDNARLHRNRAEVARTLQATLLPPELPDVPGAELAAQYHSAGDGVEVGGDFYDVFSLSDDRWVLMIGDVCGTGPAAAALTSQIRHGARVAARAGLRPAAVVPAINASLIDTIQAGRFCTMVYAELVARNGVLVVQVICAGHPPPIVVRDGYAQELPVRGPLLGVVPFARFSPMETTINPGEVMVFVTDGAIEARAAVAGDDGRRGFYGQDRLAGVIEQHAFEPASAIARSIAESVIEFGGGRLADDLAILVLRAMETGS
jgi:serine phosphatase RsbU (regulator of sigma subunit)/putative methionine-R-sulfoxide reductase with GAF domain